jgi:phospholipid transport system transporter-binding protein
MKSLGNGRFRVSGILDATTVTRILTESVQRFPEAPQIVVDLGGVTQSDSAGLALLLEWLRLARKAGHQIRFEEVPEQIMALARISEVDDLLSENGSSVAPQSATSVDTAATSAESAI